MTANSFRISHKTKNKSNNNHFFNENFENTIMMKTTLIVHK